ncbi:MAG: IPT/TIG domain-containing protein [Bryobacteraceae bacterium]
MGPAVWAAAGVLSVPPNGVYLGIWANPTLGSPEAAIEAREGAAPNGIGRPFGLHLHYKNWTDLSQELDSNGVFQPDSDLQGDISHGRIPVISWVCDGKIANSNHVIAGGDPNEDAVITATAKALAQYPGPVILRWFWEFNVLTKDQTCRGDSGGTPTQQVYDDFIGAWRHIWGLFQSAGATNVVFLWNPGRGNVDDPHGFYPGNAYVDWIGVDTYQRATTETFDDDFSPFYTDFGNSQYGNKPLMVGESGSQNFAQNNTELQWTYLQGLLADVQANRYPLLKAYDYFDAPGNTSGGWVLDDNNGQGNGGLAAMAILAASTAFLAPAISGVVNAENGSPTIAPNTWVSIFGSNLAPEGDSRVWRASDFVNGNMPTELDGVSVTVGGQPAYIFYIGPTQVNILTPPGVTPASVGIQLTVNGSASAPVTVPAASVSPSFFVFNGGPYVAAQHADYSLLGPASLYPGLTTPAKPGETVLLYANGFGATSVPVVSGSETQSGTLSPLPVIEIGGVAATVKFAGLVAPGEYQFNVVIPVNAPSGDNTLVATYNGVTTSPVTLITIQSSAPATSGTYYVAPYGNDSWSGDLAAPNPASTDGPFATFDGARAAVRALNKTGLSQVTVQFRGGTYFLPATEMFTAADSGSATTRIVFQNYPGESPVFSGGMRVQNWTNVSGDTWKTSLPASTQYFENLFYNGVRRLRPRLGGALGTYYRIAKTVYLPAAAANCPVNIPGSGWECFDRFQYDPADPIASTWKNLAPAANNACNQPAGNQAIAGDIEVLDFEQFSTSKLRISCIDTANQIVYLTGATPAPQNNAKETGFIAGNRYLVENIQDELTQPGQWFLDRSTTPWTLTYLANPGENPNTDNVIVPQLPQVLVASNLQYVTFQGLTFEHDNYTIPAAGHQSVELEPDISAAVSFQNPQHVTFDSGTVTQTSGTGIEMIPCINGSSPAYCVSTNGNAVVTGNVIENGAFYDIGVLGIRIGNPFQPADTDANVPQSTTVQNNVVEGYGRTIPAAFGIGQGMGHDNLYTHNDVYDGYHCAISTSQGIGDTTVPSGIGNANNVISFNHVHDLLQGIMNDGGSIRIDGGNSVFTAAGNKVLNNKIHDVTDASIMDSNGYGGNGVYLDNDTGLVDVENNLVYRVSAFDVYTPHGPAAPNEANSIKNNILAYGRLGMVSVNFPYGNGVPSAIPKEFDIANNLFYFDRSNTSTPKFWVQGGCLYAAGAPFTQFQEWNSNIYWRTDGAFASYAKAFAVQPSPGTGGNAPCSGNTSDYTFYTFAGWQQQVGEDLQSVVQNPGFNNPAYPADDYSLPNGSPGVGFLVFDPSQAGRSHPVLQPPAVPATFPTMLFNPATDY